MQRPPHNLPPNTDLREHRECVQRVFSEFPDKWWDSWDSATALHDSIKTLCGEYTYWMGSKGDRNVSLGGVYLLLIHCVRRRLGDVEDQLLVPDFSCFSDMEKKPLRFLPDQEPEDARRTVRALHEFFDAIVAQDGEERNKREVGSIVRIDPPVKEPPETRTRHFKVHLAWKPERRREFGETLAKRVRSVFPKESYKLSADKTTTSLMRFVLCSQVRTGGFGPYGMISLDDEGVLRVGS